jgi:hypothetical protein
LKCREVSNFATDTLRLLPVGFNGFEPNAGLTYKTASGSEKLTLK